MATIPAWDHEDTGWEMLDLAMQLEELAAGLIPHYEGRSESYWFEDFVKKLRELTQLPKQLEDILNNVAREEKLAMMREQWRQEHPAEAAALDEQERVFRAEWQQQHGESA
jgi:hypothetical protein